MNKYNVFDIIPNNFFSILSSNNKKIYANSIFIMFNYLGKGNSFGANKDDIVALLTEYYNNILDDIYLDEDTFIEVKTSREKALATLRRLKQCGWIFEEDDANYEVKLNFTYYSIPLIKTLLDIKQKNNLEYQGYIFLIYSAVKNIDINTFSDILDQIYDNTNTVMNKLKSLNSNIKKYIQELLNKKADKDLKSIVENLFIDYKKHIIDDAYQRLKTSDNVSKYRPFIISKLNELSLNDELLTHVSNNLVKKNKYTDIELAKIDVYRKIDYIIYSFENLDNIIEEIDKKNTKYIQTSISKILFIVNNTVDLEGKINLILNYCVLENRDDIEDIRDLFSISTQKNLDSLSMYTQPNRLPTSLQVVKERRILSKDEKIQRLNKFMRNNVFSKKNINQYVLSLLKDGKMIKASEIPVNNYHSYIKLILIYMYSNSTNVSYFIKKLSNKFINNNYSFYDFEIYSKRGK